MFSQVIDRCLTTSSYSPKGCGMSVRPEFYSGRGAIRCDLNSQSLEKIWTCIQKNFGDEAAESFVIMVERMPKLTATDFLIALARLERGEWKKPEVAARNDNKGFYFTAAGTAKATVYAALSGMSEADETRSIRDPFLKNHGRTEPVYGNLDKFGVVQVCGWEKPKKRKLNKKNGGA